MAPFFSIIIPTFNSATTIKTAIESILRQEFIDFEIIVIDGQSNDDTVALVSGYDDPRLKIISEPDKGIYDAMNKGISLALGKWLYFLGSDDELFNESVLRQIDEIGQSGLYDVIYGNVLRTRQNLLYAGAFDAEKLWRMNICHQGIFFNRNVFTKTGKFDLRFRSNADYDHNFKWFLNDSIAKVFADITIAKYSDEGLSSRFTDEAFRAEKGKKFLLASRGKLAWELRTEVVRSISNTKKKRKEWSEFIYYRLLLFIYQARCKFQFSKNN